MKTLLAMFVLLLAHTYLLPRQSFKEEQLKFSRVREAYTSYEPRLRQDVLQAGTSLERMQILLIAFKEEKELELWVRDQDSPVYQKLKTYPICATSGISGPKRQSGDRQIPEGFYEIDRFNPVSNYFLSLGINYPNASDKAISPHANLGGDIFIHGGCSTIGCLPLTDPLMAELYVLAVEARANGQRSLPVYFFPSRLDKEGFARLQARYQAQPELLLFWKNLKEGHDLFMASRQALHYSIQKNGQYRFSQVHASGIAP
ncbi:L,D-transpeptidase family protein [Cesiribacter andamanensis]|uniref:L,D-TPase catalytic domain-containing protein n=1 Tax=Cesiribacter andamanensis AMV16 TaxID=1279009 RepID=M7N705_9BACT|nr:hypothetical protein [Cesiribacter andamanensis]EMR03057.1 hypothetical protein ADICEAN_01786 [Cesiribacter andamanensis AMV16]